jgi:predicted DNA-binding transcriptional regulator YafY
MPADSSSGYGSGVLGRLGRGGGRARAAAPKPPAMSADELDSFAATWLARLEAVSGADADAAEQEAVLAELSAALEQTLERFPILSLITVAALLAELRKSTDPAAGVQAAATELKKLRKTPQRPFWKR